jgi:catechol 2,3-dioxygenase-like lactoylglutathione lyase family enzyme
VRAGLRAKTKERIEIMKRLHVHVAVANLEASVGFYSALFGSQPTKQKADYAKWMLDDPRVNFAISARGAKPGLDHLGIQTESPEELNALREQVKRAEFGVTDEGETMCCYAQSDKTWIQDPTGIAWEAYHTMADAELFNHGQPTTSACCAPKSAAPLQDVSSCGPKSGCC